jgi:S-adenosyl-L-methionine hydrolase (adenosine-forming)
MAVITLTTDFGLKDPSVGSVKGAILGLMPEVNVVDITHSISPFNIPEAAYVIKGAYKSFPQGTVHIIGVDSELSPENKHIALSLDGHFFVCANNGIMSMLSNHIAPRKIVEINIHQQLHTSFPVLDVFVHVACHIARGGELDIIGKSIEQIKPIRELVPNVSEDRRKITGYVIYVDNYGNVVTNISKELFEITRKGRRFEVNARNYKFDTIFERYTDIVNFNIPAAQRHDEGKKLALFNSSDFLEIALYKGNTGHVGGASTLMGLHERDVITINFQ